MPTASRNKQMNRLRSRGNLSPQTRANTDYKLAKKLQSKLNSLKELEPILEKIPKEKLGNSEYKYVTDEHVFTLLTLAEKIMHILDFKKIRANGEELYVVREKNKKKHPTWNLWNPNAPKYKIEGTPVRDAPNEKDFKRGIKLAEHAYMLRAFYDSRVPLPGYKEPSGYPIEDDFWASVMQANLDSKCHAMINELLDSGISDILQIAEKVGCQPIQVENILENRRRATEYKETQARLEQDPAAIQKIKELWAKTFDRGKIAHAVGHPEGAVSAIIDRMIGNKEIPNDWVIVPGGDFPKPSELDLLKHQEIARIMQPLLTRRNIDKSEPRTNEIKCGRCRRPFVVTEDVRGCPYCGDADDSKEIRHQ